MIGFLYSIVNYFVIKAKKVSKVITASSTTQIIVSELNHEDNQLWFWDMSYLRNKNYPTRVLDIDQNAYTEDDWGNLLLIDPNGEEHQKFVKTDNGEIVCKWNNLKIEIKGKSSILGCSADKQMWEFKSMYLRLI